MEERNVMDEKGQTMLERVENANIFSIGWNNDYGSFRLMDECDNYFSVLMTPERLMVLADEMRATALEKMSAIDKSDLITKAEIDAIHSALTMELYPCTQERANEIADLVRDILLSKFAAPV